MLEIVQRFGDGSLPALALALGAGLVDNLLHPIFEQKLGPLAVELFEPRVLFAQEHFQDLLEMHHGMVEIDDLEASRKIDLAVMFQAQSPVDEQNDLARRAAAPPPSLPAQQQAQILDRAKGANVAGGLVISNRVAFLISCVLGKDAAQISLA